MRGDVEAGIATLRRYGFDLAISATTSALPSLLAFADPANITYGSDWPFAPEPYVASGASALDRSTLNDTQRYTIDRGNAKTLFPRLRPTPHHPGGLTGRSSLVVIGEASHLSQTGDVPIPVQHGVERVHHGVVPPRAPARSARRGTVSAGVMPGQR